MTILVLGMSYRSAGVELLEKASVSSMQLSSMLDSLYRQKSVSEAVLLSTCNRVEIYAAATNTEDAIAQIASVMAEHASITSAELLESAYVWCDEEAVRHTYRVACGLDSLVVGDEQILGQLREAYKSAVEHGAASSITHNLFQSTLRVSKLLHTATNIDRVSGSMVEAALDFGSRKSGIDPAGASALIIGAGTMGSLALAALHRAGAGKLTVANRSLDRAEKLSELYGATSVDLSHMEEAVHEADIVVSATAMPGFVLGSEILDDHPQLLIDLGMPRNIDPSVSEEHPDVSLVGIAELGEALASKGDAALDVVHAAEAIIAAAEAMIEAEVEDYLAAERGREIGPVLAALHNHANEVVDAELRNFAKKQSELSDKVHADVSRTIHRIVKQLLHQPTVSARKLASTPKGGEYTALLCELFALEDAATI